jgi:tetratricopeptide (TPR) repeat protein
MGKKIFGRAATYAKNMGIHVSRLIHREETAGDALGRVARDTKKLGRALVGKKEPSGDHQDAARLVKDGRDAYNAHNYQVAEEKFRSAIVIDKNYALGYTYLGHTLFKQGRTREATGYWRQAVQLDPDSKAGAKAMQKLRMMDKKREAVNEWVHDQSERLE